VGIWPDKKWQLGLAIVLVLGAGVRGLHLIYPLMDADQAINGLMARHILLGEFPVFFYGQEYCGSLENYLLSVVFLLFGASRFTLDLTIGLVSLLLVFFIFHLSARILGPGRALVAALLAGIPSGYFAFSSVLARSAYIETPLLGVLLFILVGRVLFCEERRPALYLLAGLLSGLGLWTHFLFVFYLAPAGLLFVVREKGSWRYPQAWLYLTAGVLLGGLPLWAYNTIHPLATWHFLQGNPVQEPFRDSLAAFFAIRLPELLGLRDALTHQYHFPFFSIAVFGIVLCAWIYLVYLRRKGLAGLVQKSRGTAAEVELWLIFLLLYPLIFSLSGFSANHTTRYLMPLYPAVPILGAFLFFHFREKAAPLAWAFLVILLAAHLYDNFRMALVFRTDQSRVYQRKDEIEQATLQFLRERGIRTVYVPDYWRAVPLTFAAREEIIFAQPLADRYPLYTRIVDRSRRPAFLLSGDATAFEATLAALGGTYQKKRIGELWIFFDIIPPSYRYIPLSPRDWEASSNRGEVSVSAVVDRNLDTRWNLIRIMEPGDTFVLDLGKVLSGLGRITLLAGTREGLPRGMRLEISADGRNWRHTLSIPTYWDSLVWSGPHPFVRPEKGALELIFPPQSGRFLKIIQTGSGDRYAWEIAEVLVYRAAPAAREASPVEAPRVADLVRRLPELGIEQLRAGPWIQAHLPPRYHREPELKRSFPPLPEPTGNYLSDDPFPALVVRNDQAEGLGEALQQLDPGVYGEIRFQDLALFYDARPRKKYRLLPRSGWQVQANFNNQEAGKAIDGHRKSRWTSGVPQVPGLWFRLDLGRTVYINRLRLRLGESQRDFPRRLETRFSRNGRDWWGAAALNPSLYWDGENLFREDPQGETDLLFPETLARYVEFRQSGRDPVYYWSIHEIELYRQNGGSPD
jgi:4-amino-4-deoxy-L-arabinose transferase-like glycosyltransferase